MVDTGRSVTSSYTYTLTLTDTFGNSASASATVSTQKVVLDIHKNEGVGIGKIHEQGALDVGGNVYLGGDLYIKGMSPISQYGLKAFDTRNTNWAPLDVPLGLGMRVDFKRTDTIGLPWGGSKSMCTLLTFRSWYDQSGGNMHQIALVGNRIYFRASEDNWASGWQPWQRVTLTT